MPRLCTVIALAMTVAAAAPQAAAEQQARSSVRAPARTPRSTLTRTLPTDPSKRTLEDTLAEKLRAIWSGRALRRGVTAVYVVNARTGEPLFAMHEDRALNPASNVKLVSTATALHVLGPEWTYVTQLLGPQPDADGVIAGDIYLYGNADPTLATRHLETFAVDLLSAGVRRVDGSVVLSDRPLRDTVGSPRVLVTVTGTSDGEPPEVAVSPPLPNVQIEVTAVTSKRARRSSVRVSTQRVQDEEGDKLVVHVDGRIRAGRTGKYRRKVPSAALFTGHALRGALVEAGIEVRGGVRLSELEGYVANASAAGYLPIELTRRESMPIKELVARINKPSNNFLADRLLMTVGAVRYGGPPSLERGVAAMNEWLKGEAHLDPSSIVLDTGSGLSYQSRISPRQIVRVLRTASGFVADDDAGQPTASLQVAIDGDQTPVYAGTAGDDTEQIFLDSLAVAGVDGTLRKRYKKTTLKGLMVGKTGTLTRVIALSGFVSWKDEDPIVFSIVTNGHRHRRRNTVRYEHAKMAAAILDYMKQHREREQTTATPAVVASTAPLEGDAAGDDATAAGDEPTSTADTVIDIDTETDAETDTESDTAPAPATPDPPAAPPASSESTHPPG